MGIVSLPFGSGNSGTNDWSDVHGNDNAIVAQVNGNLDGNNLATNAVTEAKIAAGSVSSGKLAVDAVATAAIQALAVTTAKIADLNVTTAKIANLAVTAAKIANDTITATQIAPDAIGTSELAADAVGTSELAPDAVTATEIAAGAVGTAEAPDFVNSTVEDMKIIRGRVSTAAPSIINGSGFTVNTATTPNVVFSAAFSAAPAVICTCDETGGSGAMIDVITGPSTTGFQVRAFRHDDVGVNTEFDFIAIGPR